MKIIKQIAYILNQYNHYIIQKGKMCVNDECYDSVINVVAHKQICNIYGNWKYNTITH